MAWICVRHPAEPGVAACHFTAMPLYRFAVHNGNAYEDLDGTELADDEAARQEALLVIRDLTKNNEPKWMGWMGWTIEVKDGDRRVWQIPFFEWGEPP
jgi:uncharacterized protein DUF6894